MVRSYGLGVAIVDMQEVFLIKIDPCDKEMLISNQEKLLSKCTEYDIPVAVLEYYDEDPTIEVIKESVGKVPRSTYIMPKRFPSGFLETDLAQRLNEWRVRNLIVSGVNASACVFSTAEGGKREGFWPMVSKEIVSDLPQYSKGERFRYLFESRGYYVEDIWGEIDKHLR